MQAESLYQIIDYFQRRAKRFKKVAVLVGGESEEREISLKTGRYVAQALLKKGYDVQEIDFPSPNFFDKVSKIDAVFVALHGKFGEDGTVQGLLEILKIPYSSPDPVVSAFFMDKVMTKLIDFVNHPKFFVVDKNYSIDDIVQKVREIGLPFIVKPSFSGSSFGISLVKNLDDLRDSIEEAFKYSSRVIIEEFLDGSEITVGVFQREPLGVLEIIPRNDLIFSFDAKYRAQTEYVIPPRNVSDEACKYALSISRRICQEFLVDGAVRIDFKLKEEKVFFLELNTIPGMTERSLLPKIAQWRGISFEDFVEAVLGTCSLKIKNR